MIEIKFVKFDLLVLNPKIPKTMPLKILKKSRCAYFAKYSLHLRFQQVLISYYLFILCKDMPKFVLTLYSGSLCMPEAQKHQ